MSFTEELYKSVKDKWEGMLKVPFIMEMADGSLSREKYRHYMLQDYAYLKEYIGILGTMERMTDKEEYKEFFAQTKVAIQEEINSVHVPNMRELGIADDEIKNAKRAKQAVEYNDYVKAAVARGGVVYGATAMLHCSWLYAYIGKRMVEDKKVDQASPYAGWFYVYAGDEYHAANQSWIDMVDAMTAMAGREEKDELIRIFSDCLEYERGFFDMAYNMRF